MEQNISEFRKAAMTELNKLRELHGGAGLVAAPDLDRSAQEWAEKLTNMNSLENSPLSKQGEVGESISMRTSSDRHVSITGKEVTKQWYKDIEKYDFNYKGMSQANNFSQLVWLGTRQVGFGRANVDGKVIVVAHYRPAGNVQGRYILNVKPPKNGVSASATEAAGRARSPTATQELKENRKHNRQIDIEEERENGKVYIKKTETVQLNLLDYEDHKKPQFSKPPEPKGLSSKDKNFARELVESHNAKRKLHNAQPLKENKELSALAQSFAEELSRKEQLHNSSQTYNGDRLGENLASKGSNYATDYTGEKVTEYWYNEHKKFDFSDEPLDISEVGSFTQMIWKNSREIGVGKAIHKTKGGMYKIVVVCYYYPAGNMLGNFKDNVLPGNNRNY